MGEVQSTESGEQNTHTHSKQTSQVNLTPAQTAFSKSMKLDKNEQFPLMNIQMGEEEIKYADTRPHLIPKMDDKLHWEMFWMGELETLDKENFLSKVTPVLEKHGGKLSGDMREAGCMISMIAVPFTMSEEDSFNLGKEMFKEFGSDKVEEKKTHQHEKKEVISNKTPAQKAFAGSIKLEKKDFPLMNVKIGDLEFKYADTRPHILPSIGEDLHWEMFWMGELDGLDQKAFSENFALVIEKYGGKITGKMREGGCMISMISISFSMSEEKSIEMGKDMFENFGEIKEN